MHKNLSQAQKAAITHGHLKDLTNKECAKKFGVSYGTIYKIRYDYVQFHKDRQLRLF